MNIQKELDALSKAQQKLRTKYGRRFRSIYNIAVNNMANNTAIIDQAHQANLKLVLEIDDAKKALNFVGEDA